MTCRDAGHQPLRPPENPKPQEKKGTLRIPQLLLGLVATIGIVVGGAYLGSTQGHAITSWINANFNSPADDSGDASQVKTAASQPGLSISNSENKESPILASSPEAAATSTDIKSADKSGAGRTPIAERKAKPMERAAPEAKTPLPMPAHVEKSIDDIFKERDTRECDPGFTGIICREKLRITLCDGKWSNEPTPGRSLCHLQKSNAAQLGG